MPRLNEQIGVLTVADHSPAGIKNLLDLVRPEECVGRVARDAVYRRAERVQGTKSIRDVARRDVYLNALSQGRGSHVDENSECHPQDKVFPGPRKKMMGHHGFFENLVMSDTRKLADFL